MLGGLRPVVAGAVFGGAAVWLVAPHADALLFRTSPRDPLSTAAGFLLVVTMAAVAAFFPARRISRVDPAATLLES